VLRSGVVDGVHLEGVLRHPAPGIEYQELSVPTSSDDVGTTIHGPPKQVIHSVIKQCKKSCYNYY